MADKKSALPGLPPPEDEVLEFDSAPVAEDKESDPEPDDEFPAHTAPGDEEDGMIPNTLHPLDPR